MQNLFRKVLYKLLSIQEKVLTLKLNKTLKNSYSNKTSKTILSSTEHMTLNIETEKNKELVEKNVTDIVKSVQNTPIKLLEYIKTAGTKACKINNNILKLLDEEEGMLFEQHGLKALIINILTQSGFALKSNPVYIITDKKIDTAHLIHQFYKWYAYRTGLPGFDFKAQKNFKKYLKNVNDKSLAKLSLEDTLALTEAVQRDKEATDFTISFIKKTEGAKNANKKITEGGANI